jgi:hypothetical protein
MKTGFGANPAFYPMDTGALSQRAKPPGRKADHLPPFIFEVNNGGAIPPFPHSPSWLRVELNKHRDKSTATSLCHLYRTVLVFFINILLPSTGMSE